ncbi:MAG: hypothetical protein U0575_10695 [Phycisphaerales bacterium]
MQITNRRSIQGVVWTYIALGLAMMAGAAWGATQSAGSTRAADATTAAPALAAAVSIACSVGFGVLLASVPLAVVLLRRPTTAAEEGARRTPHLLEDQNRLLAQIHEHTMLSDGSKRLIYRSKEIQLLRSAIEDDMARGDYDAALTLCTTMAEEFGYREEAERFRGTIEAARRERYEAHVRDCVQMLDEALVRRDWAAAHQEAARIRRLFPDAAIVVELDQRIAAARDEHKRQLVERFLHAANHGEVETAMDLLRQLDRYLTKQEAEQLQETAHGVVARHRENLSVQFNLAARERNWAEAVRIGTEIMREFPNSKMAEEVKSMLDVLRTRATQAAVHAAAGAGV